MANLELYDFGFTMKPCPKCGSEEGFDTAFAGTSYSGGVPIEEDKLRRTCRGCGYAYFTKTKDG